MTRSFTCPGLSGQTTQPLSCDATILHGSSAISFTGSSWSGDPTVNPASARAGIEILTFDGAGNFTGTDTNNYGGQTSRNKLSGTYAVNAFCTGVFRSDETPEFPRHERPAHPDPPIAFHCDGALNATFSTTQMPSKSTK